MALKQISDLDSASSVLSTDLLHIKQGTTDLSATPAQLFALHLAATTHATTSSHVGLGNVTNNAQLKIASNLSDLDNVVTARDNLEVLSEVEVTAAIAVHANNTSNPHLVDKVDVGLGNVQNYGVTNDPDVNSTTLYASSAALNIVREQANSLADNLVPTGAILMWATSATIPAGWAVCNGQNGTVDLRGKFVRGGVNDPGNPTSHVGYQSGADTQTHTHSGQASPHALTVGQVPPHRHTTNITGRVGSDDWDPGYGNSAIYSSTGTLADLDTNATLVGSLADTTRWTSGGAEYGLAGGTHTHGLQVDNSAALDNRPAFFTVIFIQKL